MQLPQLWKLRSLAFAIRDDELLKETIVEPAGIVCQQAEFDQLTHLRQNRTTIAVWMLSVRILEFNIEHSDGVRDARYKDPSLNTGQKPRFSTFHKGMSDMP